ncbi:helix-turn-helix transcriptional regulator [Vibrio cidicii]|uniref:helix-turn-helix transcriptional regulator n=1 Tax=Vibrio cidicii TaxID=1763883 RepID=UPI0009EE1291|nr:helix-turn-helix domain-containing protein [Vibrio cidicii]MCU8566000.1 helix-turn-helix domain-containing protein [Vibrio vulnificus]
MRQDQSLQTHQQKNATRLLTYADLCELLNRDRRTIWSWCKKGIFPSPIKSPAGVCIGWRPDDVQSWMDGSYINA